MTLRDRLRLLEAEHTPVVPCRLLVIEQHELDVDDDVLRARHGLAPDTRVVPIVNREWLVPD